MTFWENVKWQRAKNCKGKYLDLASFLGVPYPNRLSLTLEVSSSEFFYRADLFSLCSETFPDKGKGLNILGILLAIV